MYSGRESAEEKQMKNHVKAIILNECVLLAAMAESEKCKTIKVLVLPGKGTKNIEVTKKDPG